MNEQNNNKPQENNRPPSPQPAGVPSGAQTPRPAQVSQVGQTAQSGQPVQSGQPRQTGPRRPFNNFRNRHNKTRTMQTHAPHSGQNPQSVQSASSAPSPRVVLGRGALKGPAAKHVAGARMQIVRPDAARPMRRSRAKPTVRTEGDVVPPLAAGVIRIIPLGGVEEVGKNMTAIEFGNDIIVVDIGVQFKNDSTPGVDFILPNTRYLEERQDKIRAVLITHGHLDHIGAIPYVMPRIGNPPLYTRLLTSVLIQKRQEEFPHVPKLNIQLVEKNSTITVGALKVRFFSVTHTIPDAMGLIIDTPYGSIVHTGDLKLDHMDGIVTPQEEEEYDRAFKDVKVLMLMADSTNVENPGFSMPEKTVHKNLEIIIQNMQGRLIIATFSSLLERLLKIIEFAEKYGKRVVVEGRSLKQNIEICKHIGLLKAKKETLITSDDIENFSPDRIIILATGAQGDEYGAIMRMSNKTHMKIKITPRDTIVLSSSVIPGNERAVQQLKDNLSRLGARILHYRIADVHSSGHANRDETAWIHKKINPKFFMPLHGYHYMLRTHCEIAKETNGLTDDEVVIPDNGSVIEIRENGTKMVKLKEKAPSGLVLVDGFSVGDVQDVVIRDRQALAQDGIFIIFGIINAANGKLKKSPDIISRGFIYLRENQDLLHEVRLLVKETIEKSTRGMNPINVDFVKDNITDAVSKYLLNNTAKRPMVIPVILTI